MYGCELMSGQQQCLEQCSAGGYRRLAGECTTRVQGTGRKIPMVTAKACNGTGAVYVSGTDSDRYLNMEDLTGRCRHEGAMPRAMGC